jgi:hypothetical protein
VSVCGNFFPFLTTIEDLLQQARESVPILVSENERFTKLESMAGKLIANLIVLGSGVLLRAVSQAYRQAIVNASKSGVAQETVQNMAHKISKTMTEHEARQILGVSEKASWEEIMKV